MYTPYHSQYLAHRLTLEGVGDEAFARSLSTARVEMKPHQVDAALFALKSPLSKGAILADEVGLGKTIEAGLVIAQRWAEQRRRVLLIVPASLRKQWTQELQSKFSVASEILESKSYRERQKAGARKPFEVTNKVVVTSYEFAARQADEIVSIAWDLVVFDEAHRLRNVFKKSGSLRAKQLRRAVQDRFKVLLTATPLQNSLLELFGLVSVVDDKFFGDENSFKTRYGKGNDPWALSMLRERLQPISRRTLRRQVLEAGHISYTMARYLFSGFSKCCYPIQRFQSDDERRFAVLIDGKHEPQVKHWLKPAPKQFDIYYAKGNTYQPDFLIETDKEMLICEVKARNELDDPVVKAKAKAASLWVSEANKVAVETGKKTWHYALIPHDAITESSTLAGLVNRYGLSE